MVALGRSRVGTLQSRASNDARSCADISERSRRFGRFPGEKVTVVGLGRVLVQIVRGVIGGVTVAAVRFTVALIIVG